MVLPDGTQKLSPIGEIQQGAADWSARNGPVGVQHVPVALMFEFMSGWTYPRSHYLKEQVFQNWGSVPWNLGDFFADGVLNEVYPGYEASGFWRDERGFNCDTPFGDSGDCVLSDAPAWMLAQYPVVILANKMRPSAETAASLREYVRQGGDATLPDGTPMHGAEIDRRAAAGDAAAQAAERRAGLALGEVLGSMCNMFDPAAIILSGSVVKCGPHWSEALGQSFLGQAMPPVQDTPLVDGTLGDDAPLIGAVENLLLSAYRELR